MRRSPELRPNLWDGLVGLAVLLAAVALGLRLWLPGGSGALQRPA